MYKFNALILLLTVCISNSFVTTFIRDKGDEWLNAHNKVDDDNGEWKLLEPTDIPVGFLRTLVGEGLCNDGENFILNSKDQIHLLTPDLEVVQSNFDAIPHNLRAEGYNHLGDCQYANGLIYFPVEEPSYTRPAIFVYTMNGNSTSTFDFMLSKSQPEQKHMPWIALDAATNILYSSEYDNADKLMMYDASDLDNLPFMGTVALSMSLDNVQGGAFFDRSMEGGDGLLYLGVNAKDTVYSVNVTTGEVKVALVQITEESSSEEYEFEGLTFLDLRSSGKGVMHNSGNHHKPDQIVHADRA